MRKLIACRLCGRQFTRAALRVHRLRCTGRALLLALLLAAMVASVHGSSTAVPLPCTPETPCISETTWGPVAYLPLVMTGGGE